MPDLDSAIALLGTYFALMAVLAVLVEAVITWLKLPGRSPLKGKPSPEDVLNEVKVWLSEDDKNKAEARIVALNKALTSLGKVDDDDGLGLLAEDETNTGVIATKVGEAATLFHAKDQRRRGFVRLVAIVFGIIFAWLFQVDTLALLSPLLGSIPDSLVTSFFGVSVVHVAGIVLSGLAASAGSSYWHDQSARLRSIKSAKESVTGMMQS